MQYKKLQIWLPLLFSVVMVAGMLAGYQLAGSTGSASGKSASFHRTSSVQELIDLIKYKYVDSVALDSMELAGLDAVIGKLDPHSVYIPPVSLGEANADIQGAFSGIGVEYQLIDDTMNVVYVVEEGPSAKAGLRTGDMIIAVEDQPIAGKGMTGEALRKMLRGAFNSKVDVTILRDRQEKKFTITRGHIPLPSLDAGYMLTSETGYIRLNKFAETTYREFMDAATTLQSQGMKKLVLDLRGNAGGLLEPALHIADELLEDGLLLVSTRGEHVKKRETRSVKPGIFEKGPLVILLDEYSASASEVLAGALQDNDRGVIVGRRSFGKGLVQEQFSLSNGGAVRLTVARYFTPTGRSIQKPYTGDASEYRHEVLKRFDKNDSLPAPDSSTIRFFTTRGGKKVYDGGGISPDFTVPPDTVAVPREAWGLYNQNLLSAYSFQMFKRQQTQISAFKSAAAYASGYTLPANAFAGLVSKAIADSLILAGTFAQAEKPLSQRLKALMARYVWRNDGYYQVMNQKDPIVLRALQYLSETK